MAVPTNTEIVAKWLRGEPRPQDAKAVELSGFDFVIRSGSYRRIAAKFALDIGLNDAKHSAAILTLNAPAFPTDHPQAGLKDKTVTLPFRLRRLRTFDDNGTIKGVKVDGKFQYDYVGTIYDINDAAKTAALGTISDELLESADYRKNNVGGRRSSDTDYSLYDQLEDIAAKKVAQSALIRADETVTTQETAAKTAILAAIAADKVIADRG